MIIKPKPCSLLFLLAAIFMAHPPLVFAKQANLMLYPTRFVLNERERNVTVDIINKGDARGSYRVELIDMKMPEDAAIRQLEKGETDPYSLVKFTRVSPRRVVLKPDEVQKVRILVRRPKDLPDGEYRSHLKVTLTETDLDNVENQTKDKNFSIQIKPRLAFTIPIIFRQGNTYNNVAIDEAKIFYNEKDTEKKSPMLNVLFSHEGTRSSMGDINVTHIDDKGTRTVVNYHPGIAIYRTTKKRRIRVPLSVPENINISKGKLQITYKVRAEQDGSDLLIAEKILDL